MRLIFTIENLTNFFAELKQKSNLSWGLLAQRYQIAPRTLYAWRKGINTIPLSFIETIVEDFKINVPHPDKTISESTLKSLAGKQGGYQRIALYGNPGTTRGRSLGGKHSVITHSTKNDSYFNKKKFPTPQPSIELAEFVGILLGDGGINIRQVFITLNSLDETEYAIYIQKLINKLFFINTSLKKRKNANAIVILISRIALVEYLRTIGLNPGNKVKNQSKVPEWIISNSEYKKACLRGLFDTDGCFFVDRHHIKNTLYYNCGVNFVNRSLPILAFFKNTLEELGFHPRQTTKFSLFLRKENEVIRFFKEIGTSNNKHLKRFKQYHNKYGRVPKWS